MYLITKIIWRKKLTASILLSLLLIGHVGKAQRNCGTDDYKSDFLNAFPMLEGRIGITNNDSKLQEKLANLTGVINIPVSVHILYNTNEQNLSDEVIQDQIDQLNKDYSGTNVELADVPDCFKGYIAKSGFHFVLSKINRRHTAIPIFKYHKHEARVDDRTFDPIKFNDLGGISGDASTQYLNVWVGNIASDDDRISDQLLGYGTFPGGINKYDGVVVYYKAVGHNDYPHFNKGRTLTHEIGHWLNLNHIWGDQRCGEDLVDDTPRQASYNSGYPEFPHWSCGNDPNGDMFMNFMDYVDDGCMSMFTIGQKQRMRALFVEGGKRSSFLQSSFINNLSSVDQSARKDENTPVITNIKNNYNDLTKNLIGKVITWTASTTAQSYLFQSRTVGAEAWNNKYTKENAIKLDDLKIGALYEIRVQAVDNAGKTTTTSTPYLFKYNPALLKSSTKINK